MRKKFLLSAIAVALASSVAAGELAKTVPIADVHMHLYEHRGALSQREMLNIMDANNVRWAGGVGLFQKDFPKDRYISAIGQRYFFDVHRRSGEQALSNEDNFNDLWEEAETLFKEGKLKGFGEIHTSNKHSNAHNNGWEVSLRSSTIERMYSIANRYNGFVQLHTEYSVGLDENLRYLSKKYPNVVTVLAHCTPKIRADQMDKLFTDLPNVMCEISGANGPLLGSHINGGRMYTKEGIRRHWLELIVKHPDRVMVGSDAYSGKEHLLDAQLKEIRELFLARLPEDIVEQIAYKNAVRLFGLKENN